MKNQKLFHASRLLLGLIFFTFGLNKFLHFIPMGTPSPDEAAAFGGMMAMQYLFPFIALTEISTGFFLLINRFSSLAAVIAMPVSLNIVLFHLVLGPSGLPLGLAVLLSNFLILWTQRSRFQQVLSSR
jgi:uncharacterized membrane protein YphA (DoxX/SURF4 family)